MLELCKEVAFRVGLNCGRCKGAYNVKKGKTKKKRVPILFYDGNKLPFPIDSAILFQVGFLAVRLTIHLPPFPSAPATTIDGNYRDVNSMVDRIREVNT
jgi:hypothetical protein